MTITTLTQKLKEHGLRVGDLTVYLWHTKGIDISYSKVCAYCKASDMSYGKPEVWDNILEYCEKKGVDWNP